MQETVKLSNGQVVMDAIGTGCRLIDTASFYQNEEAVGRIKAARLCWTPVK